MTQHERQDELDSMKMEDLNTRASVILTEKVSGTVGVYNNHNVNWPLSIILSVSFRINPPHTQHLVNDCYCTAMIPSVPTSSS